MAEVSFLRETVESAARDIHADPSTAVLVMTRLLADTAGLYDGIDATIKYQVMAINRSQDYVKASSNIALTPKLETVHLPDVLHMVRKCINNQQSGRIINIHPPVGISDYIITDYLYVSENILCLLSNAAKYSDQGGVIDARMTLADREVTSTYTSTTSASKSTNKASTTPSTNMPMIMVAVASAYRTR